MRTVFFFSFKMAYLCDFSFNTFLLLLVLQHGPEKLPLPTCLPRSRYGKREILLSASKGVQNILVETLLVPSKIFSHRHYLCFFPCVKLPGSSSLLLAALLNVGVWVLFPSSQKLDYAFCF